MNFTPLPERSTAVRECVAPLVNYEIRTRRGNISNEEILRRLTGSRSLRRFARRGCSSKGQRNLARGEKHFLNKKRVLVYISKLFLLILYSTYVSYLINELRFWFKFIILNIKLIKLIKIFHICWNMISKMLV